MSGYTAIIIDEQEENRVLLETALHENNSFVEQVSFSQTMDALIALSGGQACDAIFVDESLGVEDLFSFLISAKDFQSGQDCIFVLTKKSSGEGLTKDELMGIDTELAQPYDSEWIKSLAYLVTETKERNKHIRFSTSVSLMVSTIITEIDKTAQAMFRGKKDAYMSEQIIEACKTFLDLNEDYLKTYYDSLFKTFDEMEQHFVLNKREPAKEEIEQEPDSTPLQIDVELEDL